MFQNKRGFTLLELLIAAAIIGALAVFATQSFRATSSDIRIQNAKAKMKVFAMAATNFYEEHPNFTLDDENLTNPEAVGGCDLSAADAVLGPSLLINCGYLEFRNYFDNDFTYYFLHQEENDPLRVCMQKAQTGSRVIAAANAVYCTDGDDDRYLPSGAVRL